MHYPEELLDEGFDNGTMPDNVERLRQAVVGHRIVRAERREITMESWPGSTLLETFNGLVITLDDGTEVALVDSYDCCAFTELQSFLLHPDRVEHVITGVGTTDGYDTWHIFADMGDVLALNLTWSSGNPFYYGYGFTIKVIPLRPEPDEI